MINDNALYNLIELLCFMYGKRYDRKPRPDIHWIVVRKIED